MMIYRCQVKRIRIIITLNQGYLIIYYELKLLKFPMHCDVRQGEVSHPGFGEWTMALLLLLP